MEKATTPSGRLLMGIFRLILGKLPGLREKVFKAILMLESEAEPESALRRLFPMHRSVEDAIDGVCTIWGDGVHVKHRFMEGIHEWFYTRIPKGSRVLDVGSGIGAVAHAIAEHADAHVVGVDFAKGSLDFARERFQHPNLRFIEADATEPVDDIGEVDIIVMSSLLEHIEKRVEFLQKLNQTHHPDAFLIRVPTFARHCFAPIRQHLGLWAYTDPTHFTEYSEESFREEMADAGLTIKDFRIKWSDIWAVCVPQ